MEKIYRVQDLEFTIEKETGNLIVRSTLESTHIPFEEGIELLKALRSDQEEVIYRKELESSNWFLKLWK